MSFNDDEDHGGVGGVLGDGIKDGGGYDLREIAKAEEAFSAGKVEVGDTVEVDPMYIPVIEGVEVARTEVYEARSVIVEYDEFDNIIGVELL